MGQLSLSSARQARTAAGAHPAALSLGRSSARRNDSCRRSTPLEHRLGTQSHRPSSSGLYLGSSPYPSASRGRRSMSWSHNANGVRRDAVCCAVMEASWTRPRLHRIDLSACRTCLHSHICAYVHTPALTYNCYQVGVLLAWLPAAASCGRGAPWTECLSLAMSTPGLVTVTASWTPACMSQRRCASASS